MKNNEMEKAFFLFQTLAKNVALFNRIIKIFLRYTFINHNKNKQFRCSDNLIMERPEILAVRIQNEIDIILKQYWKMKSRQLDYAWTN